MGRQSSRLYYRGKDHKDIYYNGHYHKAMYIGSQLLWEKLPDNAFEFEVIAQRNNSLIIYLQGNVTVDWGDGNIEEISNESLSLVLHIYSSSVMSRKNVKIYGDLIDFTPKNTDGVTKILTPFPESMSWKTDFSAIFYACEDLESVPADLFANCPNVTSVANMFYRAPIKEIPEGLFDNCTKIVDFSGCFQYTSISGVPSGLFKDCVSGEIFYHCFYGTSLGYTLERGMFKNTNARNFQACFMSTDIKQLPDGLFEGCSNVTDFTNCFYNCKLSGGLPEDLFSYCPMVESFQACFYYVTYLVSIPQNLFANCQKVKNFNRTFYNCYNITSAVPELWDRTNVEEHEDCFAFCYDVENRSDIPLDWR